MSIFIRLLEKIPKLGGSIELFIFCTHILSIDEIAHSPMEFEGC